MAETAKHFISFNVGSTAIGGNLIVVFATADDTVQLASGSDSALVGVTDSVGGPANGVVDVATMAGEIKEIVAGGSISKGDALTSDANGEAVATTTAGNHIIGYALEAAAADDIFRVQLSGIGVQFAAGT